MEKLPAVKKPEQAINPEELLLDLERLLSEVNSIFTSKSFNKDQLSDLDFRCNLYISEIDRLDTESRKKFNFYLLMQRDFKRDVLDQEFNTIITDDTKKADFNFKLVLISVILQTPIMQEIPIWIEELKTDFEFPEQIKINDLNDLNDLKDLKDMISVHKVFTAYKEIVEQSIAYIKEKLNNDK